MKPLDHIYRPTLPWRADEGLTECGRPVAQFAEGRVVSRTEIAAKFREQGKQRAALSTCMTCAETANRWSADWRTSPCDLLRRSLGWGLGGSEEKDRVLGAELHALAALVEAHRDEFDGYLAGLGETVNLASRRRPAATAKGPWPRPIGVK